MNATLPLPKYHQIYLVLREQLQEGQFADGLPAETALSRQFGAGRVTVRHALDAWPQRKVRIYVGCYANDPDTARAVSGSFA